MKLYYTTGACSLASHIALHEAGADFSIEKVDLRTKETETGKDFTKIAVKGYVPALELADGEVLSEGAAILQYIADQFPDAGLAPEPGTIERARMQSMLVYTASELHKAFGPFFNPAASDADKQAAGKNVGRKLAYFNEVVSDGRDYLLGDKFSVADAYLFVMLNWTNHNKISMDDLEHLSALYGRIAARDGVQAALKAEGLLN